jgi:trehalose 6-phosphate synthase
MGNNGRSGYILTVSNRGPMEHRWSEPGTIEVVPGQGGLATALRVAAQLEPTVWLSSPLTPVDRLIAEKDAGVSSPACGSHFVSTDPAAYDLFYKRFSNEILWFLQHGLPLPEKIDAAAVMKAWQDGYEPVNQAFADAVADEIDGGKVEAVMFHDYHFYLAPGLVRAARPGVYLQQFIHIPWPVAERWSQLDPSVVQAICEGLLGNDSLVFQTTESAGNFLATCAAFLGNKVEIEEGGLRKDGRRTRVWSNGISVDPSELATAMTTPEFSRFRWDLREAPGRKTLVRVDRLDVTKNVVRGFEAYRVLLKDHPELRERVSFLALLVPSRSDIDSYREYQEESHAIAERINREFGTHHWKPINLIFENNRTQALAAMSLYDVLLVNPIADGMNLVAKEGPMVNTHDGVLVLSRKAGAYDSLGKAALGIDPCDVAGTAAALYQALTMPAVERHDRATHLKALIRTHDLKSWFRLLLEDIDRHIPARMATAKTFSAA